MIEVKVTRWFQRARRHRLMTAAAKALSSLRVVEPLEGRFLLASISGIVWNDRNGDGVRGVIDVSTGELEPTLSGRTIYLDSNDNGVLDAGEPSRTSNASGGYTFSSLPAGTYVIRQIVPAGSFASTPAYPEFAIHRTIASGTNLASQDFSTAVEVLAPLAKYTDATLPVNSRLAQNALDGSRAIIAAGAADSPRGTATGKAWVYERNGLGVWSVTGDLVGSDINAGDGFGNSVAIRGDRAFVGAPGHDASANDAGAVYVFARQPNGEWLQEAKLIATDPFTGSGFGYSISASSSEVVIGAPNMPATTSGAAYVFERVDGTWTQSFKIAAPAGIGTERFGASVKLDGDRSLVTAPLSDDYGTNSGAAYIFERGTGSAWLQSATLTYSGLGSLHFLGDSGTDLEGDLAFVGATGAPDPGNSYGRVQIFRRFAVNDWRKVSELAAPDPNYSAQFGFKLDVDGGLVTATGLYANAGGTQRGKVYVYRQVAPDSWSLISGVVGTDTGDLDVFGTPVSLSGRNILAGAGGHDAAGTNKGAIYSTSVQLVGFIRGKTWNDRDADGVVDANEPTLAGRTVYLDADDDGVLDPGETSIVTDANGKYEFENLVPGDHVVRQMVPTGWRSSLPSAANLAARVSVDAGQTLTGVVLGSLREQITGVQKLTAGDGEANDWLGWTQTSADGDYMISSAQNENERGLNAGAAYIFERQANGTWQQVQKLTASDGAAGDGFGGFVSISGTRAVVGAVFADNQGMTNAGATYVFERQSNGVWMQTAKLTAIDAAPEDWFGYRATVRGDNIIVSSGLDDDLGTDSGSAYAFQYDGSDWIQIQKIKAPDGAAGDQFGADAITFDGTTLVIGSPYDDDRGADSGSAYIYTKNASGVWTFRQKITASDGAAGDRFSSRGLEVDGDLIAVSSLLDDDIGQDSGSAYVFRRGANGTWTQIAKMAEAGTGPNAWFGWNLALHDGLLAVGSLSAPGPQGTLGAVWVYRFRGGDFGLPLTKLTPFDGNNLVNLSFGGTVAWAGRDLVVGAPFDNVRGTQSGSLYVYRSFDNSYLNGTAFNDANNNATKDAGETPIAGRTIFLDTDADGVLDGGEPSTVTDALGHYTFDDLVPGTYRVTLVQVNETSQSLPTLGGAHVVTLGSGQTKGQDFGIVNAATIVSGITWNDRNADGIRQADFEPLLSGRTVYWDKNDNGVLDGGEPSVVSDANGAWSIRNVMPGSRVFRQVVPTGWMQGEVTSGGKANRPAVPAAVVSTGSDFGSLVQVVGHRTQYLSSDGKAGDWFGLHASMDGNRAVVTATDNSGPTSGAAYVFEQDANGTWNQVAKLTPNDGLPGDVFGWSSTLQGDTVIVSALYPNRVGLASSGAVYVFQRQANGSWTQQAKLVGSDTVAGDYFGCGVSLHDDLLLVGAQQDDSGTGSAYLFKRNGDGSWSQIVKLRPGDVIPGDAFGVRVSTDGRTLVIGAPSDDVGGTTDSGSAYVYEQNAAGNWVQVAKLIDPYVSNSDIFGDDVAVKGDLIVVGARFDQTYSNRSAFVYRRSTAGQWQYASRLSPTGNAAGERFGSGIRIDEDRIAILSEPDNSDGAVYLFRDNGTGVFDQFARIVAPTSGSGLGLWSIAMVNGSIVAGMRLTDVGGTDRGSFLAAEVVNASYLRGTAFQDIDNDGIRDAGEPGNPAWTVYLDTNNNGVKDAGELSQLSDADGFYEFQDLVPGTYTVRQQPQALWTQTKPASNQGYTVTVAPGQTLTNDFGLFASATVTGAVFSDQNANGTKDGSDANLANWVVFADLDGDRLLDDGEPTTITLADGSYELSDLPIRTISIDIVNGAAWGITPQTAILTQSLVVNGKNFASAPAFGLTLPTTGTASGVVGVDSNDNGELDALELDRVSNVQFKLYRDDGDGVFEPGVNDTLVSTLTSNGAGTLSLAGQVVGGYWLELIETSSGMTGYSLYGRAKARRLVVAAQQPTGLASFAILQAYTVTTLLDELPGSNTPSHLSLREALNLGQFDGRASSAILFDPALAGGTLTLDGIVGQLVISKNVSIVGVTGSRITIQAGGNSRILSVNSGVSFSIQDVNIVGGTANAGGAINVGFGAELSATRVDFTDNDATQRGGAIYVNSGAILSLSDANFTNNTAVINGGAIYAAAAVDAQLQRVALWNNRVTGTNGDGGAIYSLGDLLLEQVTITANLASRNGGGVVIGDGTAQLVNATIASNRAGTSNASGVGGGVQVAGSGVATLFNTIVSGNVRGVSSVASDLAGSADPASHHNLIGGDARLMPLGAYGGFVRTMPLRYDSPAIEAGDNAAAGGLTTDAAGNPRLRDFDGDGTSTIDLGAFEVSGVIVVDSLLDESADTDSHLSLREAITLAGTRGGLDVIQFSPALISGDEIVVPVSLGELVIDSQIELQGRSDARVSLDAGNASRVIHIATGGDLTLSDLTLRGGTSVSGGALRNDGRSILYRVLLTGNHSNSDGGAIYNAGTLGLYNSTISNNSADGAGGAIFNSGGATVGSLDAINATIVNNRANADDAGTESGGGIRVGGGSVALTNTIVAKNLLGTATPIAQDVFGAFESDSAFNFLGAIDGSSGLNNTGTQFGTTASPIDPKLTGLADHGGPTFTHGQQAASPVTDGGDDAAAAGFVVDQRGLPRFRDGDDDTLARVDIGAFEQQTPLNLSPTLTQISVLRGAAEASPFVIRYETLLAASNANDPDPTPAPIQFRILSVLEGTLLIDGVAVVAGTSLFGPGQTLTWTPPAITFGTAQSVTRDAFSVQAFDGQISSSGSVNVQVEVTSTAEPVNYALLFSGGDTQDLNFPIYLSNLQRMYSVMTDQYGVLPQNIFVIYADGRDPGLDQRGGFNSDLSFAANVQSATRDNLRNTLINLSHVIDQNDHLLFWAYDHGLGTTNQPGVSGEEILKGWGTNQTINDEELRVWLQGLSGGDSASAFGVPAGYDGLHAGSTTYFFGQCFAGGMLDDLATDATHFGLAASNHYEASYADYFTAAFAEALEKGFNRTSQAFSYAVTHDGRAESTTSAAGWANGGTWRFNVEHPWSAGEDFAIFATGRELNAAPAVISVAPLPIGTADTELTITYDLLRAAIDGSDPTGQALRFRVTSLGIGTLWRDGVPISLSNLTQATLGIGLNEKPLVWKRPVGTSGTLNAFSIQAVANDGTTSANATVPIRIGPAAGGLDAVNDSVQVQQDNKLVAINVLTNDSGVGKHVLRIGQPTNGTASFDALTGQVRYTPKPTFTGTDSFSYVIGDGVTSDIAKVTLNVVSFDVQGQVNVDYQYTPTQLDAPPGWAAMPELSNWNAKKNVPVWTTTRAAGITDNGDLIVDVSRADQGEAIRGYGSTNASYYWQVSGQSPTWNADANTGAGSESPLNAQLMLRYMSQTNEFHGVKITSLRRDGGEVILGGIRFDSSNAAEIGLTNDAGYVGIGQVIYDLGGGNLLWQDMEPSVYPTELVPAPQANSGTYWVAANKYANTGDNSIDVAQIREVGRSGNSFIDSLLVTLNGWGGDHRSFANGMNAAGHVVGLAELNGQSFVAFYYNGSVMQSLGTLGSDTQSVAKAINASNVVVGYSGSDAFHDHGQNATAFKWQNNVMTSLGRLGNGSNSYSVARDVNDSGIIVGESDDQAFVYINNTMYSLNALLSQAGKLPAGWTMTDATAINNAGQIAATGTFAATGQTKAFLLDLAGVVNCVNDSVVAKSRTVKSFGVLGNDTGSSLSVDSIGTLTIDSVAVSNTVRDQLFTWDAAGNFVFDPTSYFLGMTVGQPNKSLSLSYHVTGSRNGQGSGTINLTVTPEAAVTTFHLSDLTATASGFTLKLSHDPDLTKLNLYDGLDSSVDAPDLVVTRANGSVVRGSLVYLPASKTLEFIATGGALTPDVYTVNIPSRADGLVSDSGLLLDGDADNAAGGAYGKSFTVLNSTQSVLKIGDLARGPGQNLATSAGYLPLTISDAAGLRSLDFTLAYDPSLLTINSIVKAAGLPGDWSVTVNLTTPGQAIVSLYGLTALTSGARELLKINAVVPDGAAYGATNVVRLLPPSGATNVLLNGGALQAIADVAVHKVAYVGDANGNYDYSGFDGALIARVAVQLDSGFDAYPMTDPLIIADADASGLLNGFDASLVGAKSIGLATPEIPNLPNLLTPINGTGVDPLVTVGSASVLPGGAASLGLTIDNANGLLSLDKFTFTFDTTRLNFNGLTLSSALGDWTLFANTSIAGQVQFTAFGTVPLAGGLTHLLDLAFNVLSAAPAGTANVSIVTPPSKLNDGGLTLSTANGSVTVIANTLHATFSPLFASFQGATIVFDQDVGNSLSPADFRLVNLASPSTLIPILSYSYDALTKTATVRFAQGPLPKGQYELRVRTTDVQGNAGATLASDITLNYGSLPADFNRDGVVNFDDLLILAQNYNQGGRTLAAGNASYDAAGLVNFDDLLILAQNYNQALSIESALALVSPPLPLTATRAPKRKPATRATPGEVIE